MKNNQDTIQALITFIQDIFAKNKKEKAVIAVSGGIDSALALTLLTKALGKDKILPILLPYGEQNMEDAKIICRFNGFENWREHNIAPTVDLFCSQLLISPTDTLRKGNIMARNRMIFVFDIAAIQNALVCGTENKSEHYLGYFTRFGDEASDLEPLSSLYKTQVREIASELCIPQNLITKAPSAGLWDEQTDEKELGFSYSHADQVIEALIDKHIFPEDINISGIDPDIIVKIIQRIQTMAFKRQVPYKMGE